MIEIYLLEQLDAFARCGTLSKAAEELHISQPALSRSMKKLEDEMGIPLFIRDQRRIALNQTGKKAAEYAARILRDEQEMIDAVSEEDRRQRTITVGSCSTAPLNHLVPILRRSFPEKSILSELSLEEKMMASLRNHIYQFAVFPSQPDDPRLFSQHFLDEQLYISIPSGHPLVKKKTLHSEDLNGLSILAFAIPFWIDSIHACLPDSLLMVQNDMDVMDELVANGKLLVLNSDLMLKDGYVPEDSVSLPVDEDFAKVSYYVTCLDSEKERYRQVFNLIRSHSFQ